MTFINIRSVGKIKYTIFSFIHILSSGLPHMVYSSTPAAWIFLYHYRDGNETKYRNATIMPCLWTHLQYRRWPLDDRVRLHVPKMTPGYRGNEFGSQRMTIIQCARNEPVMRQQWLQWSWWLSTCPPRPVDHPSPLNNRGGYAPTHIIRMITLYIRITSSTAAAPANWY